jgi:pimeloyl-ACP methyl ester carboxylesterase
MPEDIYELVSALGLEGVYVVGHDLGGMVAYAFVRRHPEVLRGAMILDQGITGIDGWDKVQGSPAVWHVHFMQIPELPEKLIRPITFTTSSTSVTSRRMRWSSI